MESKLNLPSEVAGRIWHHEFRGQNFEVHHHVELELNLVTRGRATYLLPGAKYSLRAGDAIWLFPAQDHLLFDQTPDFAMWIIVWKPETVAAASTLSGNRTLQEQDPPGSFHRRLSEVQLRRLSTLCEEIQSSDLDCQNSGLPYLLLRIWTEFHATDRLAVGQDVHPCVERAARLLRDGEDASLQVLAREVGLSPSRLSRLFKEQIGMPLSEFRNRQRLERYFQLFRSGHRSSLGEAALEAGFGSYPQFNRVFKQLVGTSPARFGRERKARHGAPLSTWQVD